MQCSKPPMKRGVALIRPTVVFLPMVLTVLAAGVWAQDTTPPRLTALSFMPYSINTSTGPATVTVNFAATDNSSGFAYFEITFVDPSATVVQRGSLQLSPATSVSGSIMVKFPRFSVAGTWMVGAVFLSDQAGNTQILKPGDLAVAGFTTSLRVTSESDTTPPRLRSFALVPPSVDTASSAAGVAANFSVTDDSSGANLLQVTFVSPSGSITLHGGVSFEPSTVFSGSAVVTLPRFSEQGTWTVGGVFLADAAGNTLALDGPGLAANGFPTTFLVKSATDTSAPRLSAFNLSTSSIDVTSGPVTLGINFTATDDIAGTKVFQVSLRESVAYVGTTGRGDTYAGDHGNRFGHSNFPEVERGWHVEYWSSLPG